MSKRDLSNYILATYDIETDPFKNNRKPEPFSYGFYARSRGNLINSVNIENELNSDEYLFYSEFKLKDKEYKKLNKNKYDVIARKIRKLNNSKGEYEEVENYIEYWGADATEHFINLLEDLEFPHLIYAHNGGKFDFMYLNKYIRGTVFVINGRLVEWEYTNKKGITHILRDSYAILPVPLSAGNSKLDIDYSKMEKKNREKNKEEILIYLKQDCVALYNFVLAFKERHGQFYLTQASAAYAKLKTKYKIENTSHYYDSIFREYYFGGRCQAFKDGELKGNIKVYDVNSMYPHAMRNYIHPMSKNFYKFNEIGVNTFFIKWEGYNYGALPCRDEKGILRFDQEYGVFKTCIHEFKVALKYNLIKVHKVIETLNFRETGNFQELIDELYWEKENAPKKSLTYTLTKLEMNSSYGKLAQDVSDYKTYEFVDADVIDESPNVSCIQNPDFGFNLIITPENKDESELKFNNVAIAASITSASRAELLEGIMQVINSGSEMLYCDTDSLIINEVNKPNLKYDEKKLGHWDLEATGTKIYIAGKKLYALYENDNCIKIASKGVNVVPRDIHQFLNKNPSDEEIKLAKIKLMNIGGERIKKVAEGGEYHFINDAPSLKLDGTTLFIERLVKSTYNKNSINKVGIN